MINTKTDSINSCPNTPSLFTNSFLTYFIKVSVCHEQGILENWSFTTGSLKESKKYLQNEPQR